MEVTEVRIMPKDAGSRKLKAYATVTFDDCFVVRNIKIIEGGNGLFVAMPARKSKVECRQCGKRVDTAKHCSMCGALLPHASFEGHEDDHGHHDVAHPVNQKFRDHLQAKIVEAYLAHAGSAVVSAACDEMLLGQ
jgi:stage V sporulation protein G